MYVYVQVWMETEIKEMILSSRQLNGVGTGLALYNVAVVCPRRDKCAVIVEGLKQCLDHVETVFYYDKSTSCSGICSAIFGICAAKNCTL